MAGSVNKVIIIGNLGADPEVKAMPSGDRMAKFPVATSENWRDKSTGERREKTEWHNVVIFNENLAKIAENYLKKKAPRFTLKARFRPANGRTRTDRIAIPPRLCCRNIAAS